MGVSTSDSDHVFLYCNTSGRPINTEPFASKDHADDFLAWLEEQAEVQPSELGLTADPRGMSPAVLDSAWTAWRKTRLDDDGYLRERKATADEVFDRR